VKWPLILADVPDVFLVAPNLLNAILRANSAIPFVQDERNEIPKFGDL
jgi:hypothetical protein